MVKNRKAGKVTRKRLKTAHIYLKQNNSQRFYEEILNAIWGYLSDKLCIPLADLSKDTAFSANQVLNLDEALRNDLLQMIETCEMARYAPSSVEMSLQDIYKKTNKLIVSLEQKIK